MKLARLFQYIDNIKINFHNILSSYSMNNPFQLYPAIANNTYVDIKESDVSIFDNFIWFAVPKSKVIYKEYTF